MNPKHEVHSQEEHNITHSFAPALVSDFWFRE